MDGNISRLSRRQFIVAGATAAGGLAIGVSALPRLADAATVARPALGSRPGGHARRTRRLDRDRTRRFRADPLSALGNGPRQLTALAMCVAEELECDWSKVRTEYASPNRNVRENNVYGDQASVGSRTVRESHEYDAEDRRQRARAADPGRGGALERAGRRMRGGQQRRHPQAVGQDARATASWSATRRRSS